MLGDVHSYVQRDAGLAHRGAGGDEYKLALIQAEDIFVQVLQPGRQAGYHPAAGRGLGDIFVNRLHDGGYRQQAADVPALAQGVYLALGGFKYVLRFARAVIDEIVYLIRRRCEISQQRPVPDDGGIFQNVRRRGGYAHELGQVLRTSLAVNSPDLHLVENGHGVDGLAIGEHGVNGFKYIPVLLNVKFRALEALDNVGYTPCIDKHRAYDRLLCGGGMRRLSAQ